jgi:hypothetical protein
MTIQLGGQAGKNDSCQQTERRAGTPFFRGGRDINYWRRGRDSNPRYPFRYGRFRGGSFQPLTHLSAPKASLRSAWRQNSVLISILAAAQRFTIHFRVSSHERTRALVENTGLRGSRSLPPSYGSAADDSAGSSRIRPHLPWDRLRHRSDA